MGVVLKSPVSRIGGKYYLVSRLTQHIPEHTCYVEPFCGACHLFFAKEHSPVEILNDIDGHLISFFRVIQQPETRQTLIECINYMPYSRQLWQEIRKNWKAGDIPENEIERVSQWYYLNRTTFAGDQKRGGFAVPSTTGRNPVQSFRNVIKDLNIIAERLRNVCIENLDYPECISRYDSPQTLFYVDPPYFKHETYYLDTFTEQDHYRLAGLLHNVKGRAMVTHYQNDLYDELYQGWNKYVYESFKGSHKAVPGTEKPKTVEVLSCNFETKTQLFNGVV